MERPLKTIVGKIEYKAIKPFFLNHTKAMYILDKLGLFSLCVRRDF